MMRIRMIFIGILLICGVAAMFGQDIPPIQADRPDQTETPSLVPRERFQFESGVLFERIDRNNTSIAHPAMLFKYGLTDRVELRFESEVLSQKIGVDRFSGFAPIALGTKIFLLPEVGSTPQTSLIVHVSVPSFSSPRFREPFAVPSFRLTMQHTMNEKMSVGYNIGAEWDGQTSTVIGIYTLTSGISLSEKAGCFMEVYGFIPRYGSFEHLFDSGLTYLVRPNLMIDVSAGFGLTSGSPDHFVGVGFSIRLPD